MSRRQTAQSAETRKTTPPITAHRLFPALVAIWFAALFGLGSFALPASLIERVIVMIGLPAAMPAAAPPLGITARLLIALALTVAGIVLGLLLALRLRARSGEAVRYRKPVSFAVQDGHDQVAASEPVSALAARLQVRAIDSHPDAPPRRPFSLSEDLVGDAEGIARADHHSDLSVEMMQDADFPSGQTFVAETHGDDQFAADLIEGEVAGDGDAHPGFALLDDAVPAEPSFSPKDAGGVDAEQVFAALDMDLAGDLEIGEAVIEDGEWSVAPLEVAESAAPDAQPAVAIPALVAVAEASPVTALRAGTRAGTALTSAPLDQLGLVQLVERLALAIDGRMSARPIAVTAPAAVAPQQSVPGVPAPVQAAPVEAAPVDIEVEAATTEPEPPAAPAAPSVERPAIERQVFIVPPTAVVKPAEDVAEPASVPAMPRFPSAAAPASTSAPAVAPRILSARWDDADHADDDEIVVPRFLGLAGAGSAAVAQPAADRGATPESAHAAPRETPRQEFVRVDLPVAPILAAQPGDSGAAEPVVVFPGQGPRAAGAIDLAVGAAGRPALGSMPGNVPQVGQVFATGVPQQDPEEADRALRAALATLQRMTARG